MATEGCEDGEESEAGKVTKNRHDSLIIAEEEGEPGLGLKPFSFFLRVMRPKAKALGYLIVPGLIVREAD